MDKCKKTKSLFEKALYNELQESEYSDFNIHMQKCDECNREFSELKETLHLFQNREREEANPQFIENLWDNITPEIEKIDIQRNWFNLFLNNLKTLFRLEFTWSKQLATGLAILIIGVFIGKYLMNPEVTVIATENNLIDNQQIVQAKANRYLNRSKVLLLGLINYNPSLENIDAINLPKQKEISQKLVAQASELKNELKNPSQRKLKELISDLEVVLLQIANLESEYDLSGIDLVKTGVDKRGIFLKINLQKMQQSNTPQEKNWIKNNEKNI